MMKKKHKKSLLREYSKKLSYKVRVMLRWLHNPNPIFLLLSGVVLGGLVGYDLTIWGINESFEEEKEIERDEKEVQKYFGTRFGIRGNSSR